MHSKPHCLLPKALLLATGLLSCALVFADETTFSSDKQDNVTNSEIISVDTLHKQETKSLLNNPNAALVAMAFKFNRIDGSPNSYTEVVANYCKQAKAGDADAFFALAWMYENGKGVSVDKSIAAQLYAKAAEQGHNSAKQSLTRITGVQPSSTLPNCLLPDPPVAKATHTDVTSSVEERKTISEKTAALFYSQRHVLKLVNKLAPRYKIDTNLVMAFIAVESGFNVQATSVKNAQGLMQLIPATAQRFGVKDAYKAEDNIKGGLAYLRWLLAYYKGDVELVAAAYNAGEGAVDKHKGVPPYPETRMYVKKIASLYNNSTHPYQDNFAKKASVIHDFPKKKTM